MKVRNIEIGKLVGEAPKFRIYLGTTDTGQEVVLKVAKTFEDGDVLSTEASKLNMLRCYHERVEGFAAYGVAGYHYDWLFANLESSFMEPTQGDRRINILSFVDTQLSKLVPLPKLQAQVEIDAKSSVWILGRFFKFYTIFEGLTSSENQAAKYPLFSPGDYLINPEWHRLIYYNFSGELEDIYATDFVKSVSKFILDWVHVDGDHSEQRYLGLLKDFAENGRVKFGDAHHELYTLIDDIWGSKYHPFTYRERNTQNWITIQKED